MKNVREAAQKPRRGTSKTHLNYKADGALITKKIMLK